MKYSWMSPITLSENSVEKMQVFCPWSSFKMSACTVPLIRIKSIQGDGIKRRGKAFGRHVAGEQVEALVGAERIALAREHARGILVLALEMENPGSKRELAGDVLAHAPAQELAVVLVLRQRDLRHFRSRKRGLG